MKNGISLNRKVLHVFDCNSVIPCHSNSIQLNFLKVVANSIQITVYDFLKIGIFPNPSKLWHRADP